MICRDNKNNSGSTFILYAALVANLLAKNLETAEQELLGIFLQQVGSDLSSIAACEAYLKGTDEITYNPNIGPVI